MEDSFLDRQYASPFRCVFEGVFGKAQHHHVATTAVFVPHSDHNFDLFSNTKSEMKGTRFESVDSVEVKAVEIFIKMTEHEF